VDLIPVTSVKNWLYCPRQVYFVEACGLEAPPSWKMREGQLAQQERERLEERRSLFGYGLRDRKRLYGLRLASNSLGIAGSPDLVLEGGGQAAVVEFKLTAGDADPATWLQLACYAALVEEVRRVPWTGSMPSAYPEKMSAGNLTPGSGARESGRCWPGSVPVLTVRLIPDRVPIPLSVQTAPTGISAETVGEKKFAD